MASPIKSKIVVLLIATPLVAYFTLEFIFGFRYFNQRRVPDKFVLPENFIGWVIAEFENPNCDIAIEKKGYREILINKEGYTCTQSKALKGWAENHYQFTNHPDANLMQNPKSNLNWIWNENWVQKDAKLFYIFYVGRRKIQGKDNEIFEETIKPKLARFL